MNFPPHDNPMFQHSKFTRTYLGTVLRNGICDAESHLDVSRGGKKRLINDNAIAGSAPMAWLQTQECKNARVLGMMGCGRRTDACVKVSTYTPFITSVLVATFFFVVTSSISGNKIEFGKCSGGILKSRISYAWQHYHVTLFPKSNLGRRGSQTKGGRITSYRCSNSLNA